MTALGTAGKKKKSTKIPLGAIRKEISLQKFHDTDVTFVLTLLCMSVLQLAFLDSILDAGRREMFSSQSVSSLFTKK